MLPNALKSTALSLHAGVVRTAAALGTPPDFPAAAVAPLLSEMPAEAFTEGSATQQALQGPLALQARA